MNVRAAAIGLTVLGHLLVLLLLSLERRTPQHEVERALLQFVSIWPESRRLPVQPQPAAQRGPQSLRPAPAPRKVGPVAPPHETAASLSSVPSTQLVATDSAARAPVDWVTESKEAAARFAANGSRSDTFSPPPNVHLPSRLCKPREISEAMQAKMDELLGLPADPPPAPSSVPAGSVMMPGGIRVGMVSIGALLGLLGKKGARHDSPDHINEPRKSSVPDPNNCD